MAAGAVPPPAEPSGAADELATQAWGGMVPGIGVPPGLAGAIARADAAVGRVPGGIGP